MDESSAPDTAVTGLEPKKAYVLALSSDSAGAGPLEPLASFTANPVGAAIVRIAENPGNLAATLGRIAAAHGAEVVPLNSGWVDSGISLGSNQVVPLKAPRIVLAWDTPTNSLSAGWARYVLERRYGLTVTAEQFQFQAFLALAHGPFVVGRKDRLEQPGKFLQERLFSPYLPVVGATGGCRIAAC